MIGEKIYKFMDVYNKQRSQNYRAEVNENPVITKKGKKINLRDYVNEGFEMADLATNLKKFGSIENIKKEEAFLMLDNELLDGDMRDILDLQIKAKNVYNQLSLDERRNLSLNNFINNFQTFKNQKETEKEQVKVETNTNNNNNEVKE